MSFLLFVMIYVVCIQADYSNWMAFLSDNILITDVSIPGTYQSCTKRLGPVTGAPYQAQSLSIKDQLSSGVRFFDVIGEDAGNNNIFIVKGSYTSEYTYKTFQDALIDFLRNKPSEFLIIKITSIKDHDGTFYKVLDNNIKDYIDFYWPDKNIPTVGQIRRRIFILQNYTNISSPYFRNNNVIEYEDLYVSNCSSDTISQKILDIKKNIDKASNKKSIDVYTTFCTAYEHYNYICFEKDCSCNILNVSSSINPLLNDFIDQIKSNNIGIVAFGYINEYYANTILLKNTLYMDRKNEFIITICTCAVFIIGCIALMLIRDTKTKRIILQLFVSCFYTTIQIVQMYYHLNMDITRNFNTKLNSQFVFNVSISLFVVIIIINVMVINPVCTTNTIKYFLCLSTRGNFQSTTPNDINNSIQMDEIKSSSTNNIAVETINTRESINTHNNVDETIDEYHQPNNVKHLDIHTFELDGYKKYLFLFFTIYGNCNYLYKKVYVYTKDKHRLKIYVPFVVYVVLMIVMQNLIFSWNILMLLNLNYKLAIPWIMILCIFISFWNYILNIYYAKKNVTSETYVYTGFIDNTI